MANEGIASTITFPEKITKIKFNSNPDGFHGQFAVRDPNNNIRKFECEGCESTSTSLMLGSLYLDSNQDGVTDREHTANCRDNCTFNLKGSYVVM